MIKLLNNNRGVALLLTVLVISLILVATLQFNTDMRSDLSAAANLRDSVRLGYTARSVFNLARAVLSLDARESDFDSEHETWAELPALTDYATFLFDGDKVKLEIADQSARIQINALLYAEAEETRRKQRELLMRLLQSEEFGLDEESAGQIIEAILDWLDEDDEVTGFGGAENSYYHSLETPYSCKNGPFEFIEELLFVRGVTRELFYGNEGRTGLKEYLTVYGTDGKININTAAPLVLMALSDQIDAETADNLIAYRGNEDNDLSDMNWYKSVPAFPGDVEIDAELITISSAYFELQAEAFLGAMTRKITGVIERRADKSSAIVSWKSE